MLKRMILHSPVLFALLLIANPLFVNALLANEPKVVVIGIDGLRADALEQAFDRGIAPNLKWLADNGTYCPNATVSDLTFSGPGWSDLLYGIHRDQHGVTTNSVSGNIFSGSNQRNHKDLLALVKQQDPSLTTARWTTWEPLSTTRTPGGTDYNFYRPYSQNGDFLVTQDAVAYFQNRNADVSFFYLGDVDIAGHSLGFHPAIPGYLAEISSTDALIGDLLNSIRGRSGYQTGEENWLFLVGSDHGGNLGRGHNGNRAWDRHTFMIVSGNDAIIQIQDHGAKNVDIVTTALAHMGLDRPENLAGNVVGLTGSYFPPVVQNSNLIFNGDAEFDHGFPSIDLDQAIAGWVEQTEADYLAESAARNGFDTGTVIAYGSSGFPGESTPGVGMNDANFFCGSARGGTAAMSQFIDLTPLSLLIETGDAEFVLSAELGGRGTEADYAEVAAIFRDANGDIVSRAFVEPVKSEDRQGQTSFLFRSSTGFLPRTTRSVEVVLSLHGTHAYADNLRLVIREGSGCLELIALETFDELELIPFSQLGDENVGDYSADIPNWTIDNSNLASPSAELAFNGVTAMNVDSWIDQQGAQIGRGSSGLLGVGTGNTALVFDSDAWHDFSGKETNGFDSAISSTYQLTNAEAASLVIEFDWEFATEGTQLATVEISFDGGSTWQNLLFLDSESYNNNTILSNQARFEAFQHFFPTSNEMTLRFRKQQATNNWWFAVDNVRVSASGGTIRLDDFEGLNMEPFSLGGDDILGDGSDFTNDIGEWTVDNSRMRASSSELAYQGWTAMDVQSWIEEQNGQERSIFRAPPRTLLWLRTPMPGTITSVRAAPMATTVLSPRRLTSAGLTPPHLRSASTTNFGSTVSSAGPARSHSMVGSNSKPFSTWIHRTPNLPRTNWSADRLSHFRKSTLCRARTTSSSGLVVPMQTTIGGSPSITWRSKVSPRPA